ncbi:hypothetical protein E8D34_13020 [Nocardioides sp. GY 10113]|uniref:hypothetical protein n=1 Tax=Nocardioides sp. GY 10113 TaxID=2569761 RepID=UPI0010A8A622|nr:hypothetical protein [Nocardioides sp. GY 10113]TIC85004.1 hypothetical protein E8D34_13020 [Nocardioides sp. GY 10113]
MAQTGLSSVALTSLVVAAAVSVWGSSGAHDDIAGIGVRPQSEQVDRIYLENRCSVTGFTGAGFSRTGLSGDGTPTKALIRRESGRIALVSFAEGWRIHTGGAPGELMAVCLGPATSD